MIESRFDVDLNCIGSGPAGQRAAIQAAKLGKRVAVVETQRCIGSGATELIEYYFPGVPGCRSERTSTPGGMTTRMCVGLPGLRIGFNAPLGSAGSRIGSSSGSPSGGAFENSATTTSPYDNPSMISNCLPSLPNLTRVRTARRSTIRTQVAVISLLSNSPIAAAGTNRTSGISPMTTVALPYMPGFSLPSALGSEISVRRVRVARSKL